MGVLLDFRLWYSIGVGRDSGITRWLWTLCLCLLGVGVACAQGRVIVVKIWHGEALFERSAWLQSQRASGGAGWLMPNPTLWLDPQWNPDYWLSDPDVPDRPRSEAVRLTPAETYAYGVRSSPSLLSSVQRRALQMVRWAQVDLGDVARAERYAKLCSQEQANQLISQAWRQVDAWCAYLSQLLTNPSDRMVVLGVPDDPEGLWAVFIFSRGTQSGGVIHDARVSLPTVARSESLWQVVQGELPFQIATLQPAEQADSLAIAPLRWAVHQHAEPLQRGLLVLWMLLLLAMVMPLRVRRKRPVLRVVGSVRPKPSSKSRLSQALTAWGVWAMALSLASLFPAGLSPSGSWAMLAVWLVGAGVLVLIAGMLDDFVLGLGALAGLGLTLLLLDSFSGGNWARDGLLGYATLGEGRTIGLGDAYGTLALVWALTFSAVWLRIEGNPLGAVYLMAGTALWLGWRAHHLPLTLIAVLSALVVSAILLRQEAVQRRRLRLSLMRAGRIATRTTPIPHERKLITHVLIMVGMLLTAIGLGIWNNQPDGTGYPSTLWALVSSGWLGVALLSVVGLFMLRRLRTVVPEAIQFGWLALLVGALFVGLVPLSLALLSAWAFLLSLLQQETDARAPNPKPYTGGTK
ncbi:MAG: hypothetical protein SNJ72_04975 [Fimbriimonadales bacterium]